jgi:hypothetical protein
MSFRLDRPPRTNDELYDLVRVLWNVTIPRHKVCLEHNAPFDAFATAFFAREPQVLVHGSRGLSGKSVMMSILGLTNAVVWGSDCNILGGSLAQSNNVLESMQRAWEFEDAPRYMLASDQRNEQKLTNNARIRPLTASQKTVRGPHPARLLLDEIDEMDSNILAAAMGQPMPQKNWVGVEIPAQTTMVSTWQYPEGTMTAEMRRFRENDLPIYSWCFKDTANPIDGWLAPDTIEQKRREIPREMWRVEYELGEPSIGNRAIATECVEDMFDVGAPKPVKHTREHQEYAILQPSVVREYVVSADWARDMDWTVIGVWDVTETPIRLAYYVRLQRRPYPYMIGLFNALQRRYHAEGIHDATGLGGVVSDLIDGKARNFLMTGRNRDDMLSEFVAAVEHNRIRASRIDSFYTACKYVSTDDLFSRAKEFHLPDEVCSAALAWKAVSHRFPNVMPYVAPKAQVNWMGDAVSNNRDFSPMALTHGGTETKRGIDGEVVRKDEDEVFSLS